MTAQVWIVNSVSLVTTGAIPFPPHDVFVVPADEVAEGVATRWRGGAHVLITAPPPIVIDIQYYKVIYL